MKVLQVTTNYPSKSNPIFGIFMKEQVESLEKYGVENTIFFSNGADKGFKKTGGGAFEHLKSVFKLQWHLLTHKYDLIHCHSNIGGTIVALSGAWIFNKCILSFQNDPEKYLDARFFKFLYPFFKKIIVKKPTKYLERDKVIYLPNGCNTDFFKPLDKVECKRRLGLDPEKRYILFVDSNTSRKRTQKRKDRFDEVMQILKDDFGYSNLQELILIGVGRDLVPTYMNACDLHLMTSDLEGSPNSIKECIMCNVPIVSTDVGNVRDMIDGIEGAYVSDTFDAVDIAALVDKVLNSDRAFDGREVLIAKGYGIDATAQKLIDIYNGVVSKS